MINSIEILKNTTRLAEDHSEYREVLVLLEIPLDSLSTLDRRLNLGKRIGRDIVVNIES